MGKKTPKIFKAWLVVVIILAVAAAGVTIAERVSRRNYEKRQDKPITIADYDTQTGSFGLESNE